MTTDQITSPPVPDAMREAVAPEMRHFDEAYSRALETSHPDNWMTAALYGRQLYNAVVDASRPIAKELDALRARAEEAERLLAARLRTNRWNVIEGDAGAIMVCHGHHEKSEDCDWIEYVPAERLSAHRAAQRSQDEEIARLRAKLSDVEGKCELARSVYATEQTATPSRAAEAFALIRDAARAALAKPEPTDV